MYSKTGACQEIFIGGNTTPNKTTRCRFVLVKMAYSLRLWLCGNGLIVPAHTRLGCRITAASAFSHVQYRQKKDPPKRVNVVSDVYYVTIKNVDSFWR